MFLDVSKTHPQHPYGTGRCHTRPLGSQCPLRVVAPGQEKYPKLPKGTLDIQLLKLPHKSLQHLIKAEIIITKFRTTLVPPSCPLPASSFGGQTHDFSGQKKSCCFSVNILDTLHGVSLSQETFENSDHERKST